MKKITMNQEELLQAMKLRPDILVAIRFLKEARGRSTNFSVKQRRT